jgi:hypothetical protein
MAALGLAAWRLPDVRQRSWVVTWCGGDDRRRGTRTGYGAVQEQRSIRRRSGRRRRTSRRRLRAVMDGARVPLPNVAHPKSEPTMDAPMRDHVRGALIRPAVGDAVGTAVVFKRPGTFAPVTDIIGGDPFNLGPGERTDGTSITPVRRCASDCDDDAATSSFLRPRCTSTM